MAKRTRYGSKSSAKPAAKRVPRPGASAAMPGAAPLRSATSTGGVAIPHTHDHDDHEGHDHGDMPLRSGAALTEAEVARAAELEAAALAQERAVIAESLRRRSRVAGGAEHHAAGDINAPLSVRMSHEYDYVSRDVKRIALTASLMVTILAVLHILVNVLGVITL